MHEQRKIFRIFQLISRLRSPLGCSKGEVARDFEVTIRTIERYFMLLEDLGFELEREHGRCKLKKQHKTLDPESLIVFSPEEAAAIRNAIIDSKISGPLGKSLLDKLYALTDLEEVSETIYRQTVSKTISVIRQAIKNKEQVLLKNYHSVNSETTGDRLVEPVKFLSYYNYLLAYEVESGMVKQYKTERITRALSTGQEWQHESSHRKTRVDIFGMSGPKKYKVILELGDRARHLLEEEFPGSETYMSDKNGVCRYTGEVYDLNGIGRFVMGLMDQVKIIEPEELKAHLREKMNIFLNATEIVGRGM